MKNVLILSASPRENGNSETLCREFARGAEEAGHTTELIPLRERKIGACRACYACFHTGTCVQQDDMGEILEKMQRAEVLVIATPTCFLTMNGTLKTAIDRLLPRWQELDGHDVYLIITGHDGRNGLQLVAEELTAIFEHLDSTVRGIIWGDLVWQEGEILGKPAMEEARRAGRAI